MGKNLEPKLELLEKKLLVSVKTDLKNTYFKKFYNDFFKLPIPKPLKFVLSENYMVCWMSYDEILIIADLKLRNDLLKKFDTFNKKDDLLIFDVSDTRSILKLTGDNWRNVISKGCPRDISKENFRSNSFFRSRLSSISVAFWLNSADSISIMCPKSLTEFTFNWITHSKNIDNISNIY